jgi:hypothetical protein
MCLNLGTEKRWIKPNRFNTTFVTGYWELPGNPKHGLDHYITLIPKTLEHLRGFNVVLFYDNESVNEVFKSYINSEQFFSEFLPLYHLPAFHYSNKAAVNAENADLNWLHHFQSLTKWREKGLAHYEREIVKGGTELYKKLFTIWASKPFLINYTIDQNPFHTSCFAWIDPSLARVFGQRSKWKFYNQLLSWDHINHYDSPMFFKGKKQDIQAGFLFSSARKWKEFLPYYRNEILECLDERYPHDEETILNSLGRKHPKFFNKINKFDLIKIKKRIKKYYRKFLGLAN